ncbi:hypothetical protein MRX96_023445 [Rhipicephalus microplus]
MRRRSFHCDRLMSRPEDFIVPPPAEETAAPRGPPRSTPRRRMEGGVTAFWGHYCVIRCPAVLDHSGRPLLFLPRGSQQNGIVSAVGWGERTRALFSSGSRRHCWPGIGSAEHYRQITGSCALRALVLPQP